jgi:hypothetical protein
MTLIHVFQALRINLLPKLLEMRAQLAIAQALQQVLWKLVLEGNIRISMTTPISYRRIGRYQSLHTLPEFPFGSCFLFPSRWDKISGPQTNRQRGN